MTHISTVGDADDRWVDLVDLWLAREITLSERAELVRRCAEDPSLKRFCQILAAWRRAGIAAIERRSGPEYHLIESLRSRIR